MLKPPWSDCTLEAEKYIGILSGGILRTKIGKHFDFESAHQLHGAIYGKCQNLHGHRYHLVIEVEGEIDNFGWVCDFAELEDISRRSVIDKFDHRNLNDYFEVPTVENIAKSVFEILDGQMKTRSYKLSRVLLYETPDCYAEIVR